MKCWSTMPAEEAEAVADSRPSFWLVVGPSRDHRLDGVPPRIIGCDIIAAPALEPATRPPAAWAARMAARSGVSTPLGASEARMLAGSAAGEVDAGVGADAGDEVRVAGEASGVLRGERRHLGVEAVRAEDLQAFLAHRLGLGGGGGEDEDAPAGEAMHLGEDGDVAVFEPPADDGEAAGGRLGHARASVLGHDAHAALVAEDAVALRHVEARGGDQPLGRHRLRRLLGAEVDDLLPAAGDAVAEDEDEVVGPGHLERGLHALRLAGGEEDGVLGHAEVHEGGLHQLRHLVGSAAAGVVVGVAEVGVEVAGHLLGDVADVLVAAVAGGGDADDALAERLQALDEVDHGADGGLVVAVVEDDAEAVLVEDVHAAGRLVEGVVEGPEAVADLVEREPEAQAMAAVNMAFSTLCSALPSTVAGMRWVQISGS